MKDLILDAIDQIKPFVPTLQEKLLPWELLSAFQDIHVSFNADIVEKFPGVTFLPGTTLTCGKNVIIQPNVTLSGNIILGNDVFIGAYSFLRGSIFIGSRSVIGSYNEIVRSIILEDSKISHRNDVFDSLIGNNCWLSGGIGICNSNLDDQPIKIIWKDELYRLTKGNKLGAIMKNNVTLGLYVNIYPGTVIEEKELIIGPSVVCQSKNKGRLKQGKRLCIVKL